MEGLLVLFFTIVCSSVTAAHGNSTRLSERFLTDGNTVTVTIDSHHSLHTLSDKFVSVTVDVGTLKYHLKYFHVSNKKFRAMARGLAPAYFRFGGTSADYLSFQSGPSSEHVIMDAAEFDTIYEFSKAVGWEMIFNLNLLHRHNGQWDSTNAELLMKHIASKGYVVHLELGNEPNMYERNGIHIDPAQIGRDYGKLRHLMDSIHPFNQRMLVGPALTGYFHEDFAQKFLSTGSTYIDAFTVHHYYMSGETAKESQFLDPDTLDSFQHATIHHAQDSLSKASKGTHTIWLAETSSAYGGGAHTLSESFIAGFLWLDKLGLAAVNGVQMVARQDFTGGRYGLVTGAEQPLPDYWLTLLFKRLVGRKVLKVSSSEHNRKFRVYAHCSADHSHPKGVTFFFQNMYNTEVKFSASQYTSHYYQLYILTADSLTSKSVKLNGHELRMNGDALPHIEPITERTWPVKVPKYSFGFLVSPHADAAACP